MRQTGFFSVISSMCEGRCLVKRSDPEHRQTSQALICPIRLTQTALITLPPSHQLIQRHMAHTRTGNARSPDGLLPLLGGATPTVGLKCGGSHRGLGL